jgi:hypothetical protein
MLNRIKQMGIVAIKLWELGLDFFYAAAGSLEFFGAVDHGANIGCTLSGGEIERAILGLAE